MVNDTPQEETVEKTEDLNKTATEGMGKGRGVYKTGQERPDKQMERALRVRVRQAVQRRVSNMSERSIVCKLQKVRSETSAGRDWRPWLERLRAVLRAEVPQQVVMTGEQADPGVLTTFSESMAVKGKRYSSWKGIRNLREGSFTMETDLGCILSSREFTTWSQTLRG